MDAQEENKYPEYDLEDIQEKSSSNISSEYAEREYGSIPEATSEEEPDGTDEISDEIPDEYYEDLFNTMWEDVEEEENVKKKKAMKKKALQEARRKRRLQEMARQNQQQEFSSSDTSFNNNYKDTSKESYTTETPINSADRIETISEKKRKEFFEIEREIEEQRQEEKNLNFRQSLIDNFNRKQEIYNNTESIGSHGIDFSEKDNSYKDNSYTEQSYFSEPASDNIFSDSSYSSNEYKNTEQNKKSFYKKYKSENNNYSVQSYSDEKSAVNAASELINNSFPQSNTRKDTEGRFSPERENRYSDVEYRTPKASSDRQAPAGATTVAVESVINGSKSNSPQGNTYKETEGRYSSERSERQNKYSDVEYRTPRASSERQAPAGVTTAAVESVINGSKSNSPQGNTYKETEGRYSSERSERQNKYSDVEYRTPRASSERQAPAGVTTVAVESVINGSNYKPTQGNTYKNTEGRYSSERSERENRYSDVEYRTPRASSERQASAGVTTAAVESVINGSKSNSPQGNTYKETEGRYSYERSERENRYSDVEYRTPRASSERQAPAGVTTAAVESVINGSKSNSPQGNTYKETEGRYSSERSERQNKYSDVEYRTPRASSERQAPAGVTTAAVESVINGSKSNSPQGNTYKETEGRYSSERSERQNKYSGVEYKTQRNHTTGKTSSTADLKNEVIINGKPLSSYKDKNGTYGSEIRNQADNYKNRTINKTPKSKASEVTGTEILQTKKSEKSSKGSTTLQKSFSSSRKDAVRSETAGSRVYLDLHKKNVAYNKEKNARGSSVAKTEKNVKKDAVNRDRSREAKLNREIRISTRSNKKNDTKILSVHAKKMGLTVTRHGKSILSTLKSSVTNTIQSGDYEGMRYLNKSQRIGKELVAGVVVISGAGRQLYRLRASTSRLLTRTGNVGRYIRGVNVKELKLYIPTTIKQYKRKMQSFGKLNNLSAAQLNKEIWKLQKLGINKLSKTELIKYNKLIDLKKTRKIGKKLSQSKQARAKLLSALSSHLQSLLSQGDSSGIEGLLMASNFATNKYVRNAVKETFKLTYRASRATFKLSGRVAKTAYKVAVPKTTRTRINKTITKAKSQILHAKPVMTIKKGVNGGAYNAVKKGVSKVTPKPIKTAATKGKKIFTKSTSGLKKIKNKVINKVKNNVITRTYKTIKSGAAAIKSVFGSLIKKILLICSGILIIVLVVAMILQVCSAALSVFMDETKNIQGYVDCLNDKQKEFNGKITDESNKNAQSGSGYKYDNVFTHFTEGSSTDNTREILSMAAVFREQNLPSWWDLVGQNQVKDYLRSVFDDSHSYTVEPSALYYCENDPNASTDYCTHRKTRTYYCNKKYAESDRPSSERKNLWYTYGQYGGCKTRNYYCTETGHAIYNADGCKTKYCGSTIKIGGKQFNHASTGSIWGCSNQTRHVISKLTSDLLPKGTVTFKWSEENERWEYTKDDKVIYFTNASLTPTKLGTYQLKYTYNSSENVYEYGVYYQCNGHKYCDGQHTERYCDGKHEEYYCPGDHQDLDIYITVLSFDGDKIFEADTEGNKYSHDNRNDFDFEGWTEDYKSWALNIYNQDWEDLYDGINGLPQATKSETLSDEEVEEMMNKYLPANCGENRKAITKQALLAIGRIPYYENGKADQPGLAANNFGIKVAADSKGRTLKGLDSSHFVQWVYWTAINEKLGNGTFTDIWDKTKSVSESQLKPGDIGFQNNENSETNYVGIYLGKTSDGKKVWIHLASDPVNNVVTNTTTMFKYYRTLK